MNKPVSRSDSFSINSIYVERPAEQSPATPSAKPDKCKRALNGMMCVWSEVVNFGGSYLLGSQAPLGPSVARMAAGFAGVTIATGALSVTAGQDMNKKQRWIAVAVTVVILAGGIFTGVLVGF